MSDASATELEPLTVAQYLLDNPNFFDLYPELLPHLRVNHPERGAISLVERQQQLLRERLKQLETEQAALLSTATRNEQIHQFYSKLLFDLLEIDDLQQLTNTLEQQLKQQFRFVSVTLFRRNADGQFAIAELAPLLKKRLDHRGYYLGRLPAAEARLLVQIETGSVALIGLGEPNQWLGVLAIASHDPSHFAPDMGTMLLDNLQQMLTRRLRQG
ncbi:DUF484 family protein [Ferrimonas senticii]|uniref:DUF484 family protein n=1 Tax=Ferrimonas senticii TaxID=394566 RepID=UPI000419C72A|nr:DUF484 family protein [Ferrimonas senticii]